MSDTDLELLGRYAGQHAEDAFTELVRRHINLVYAAALRQVRSSQLAEEVAQSVFLKLANEARRLAPDTILTAWLYQVARRASVDVVRREARRQLREKIFTEMNATDATAKDWQQIEPLLDEGMSALGEIDRAAILLRYFENKSLREVGAAFGATDDAAQKRVRRAVEHLREFFVKRGITVSAAGVTLVISANAVPAAPVGLAMTIATAATLAANISVTTVATQIPILAMKLITIKAIVTVAFAAGTAMYFAQRNETNRLRTEIGNLTGQQGSLITERDTALSAVDANKAELERLRKSQGELFRLRGEVGVLKQHAAESARKLAANAQTPPQQPEEKSAADQEKEANLASQQAIAKMSYARNWILALISYANQNGGQFPTNFDQAALYLADNAKDETLLATNQFELLYNGSASALTNDPSNIIVVRETQPVEVNGGWMRTYGFADGHSEVHREMDGDFTAWEQARMASASPGQ